MGEQAKSKDQEALNGCVTAVVIVVVGIVWLVAKCTGPDKPPEPVEVVDYCPDHEQAFRRAKGEVEMLEGDIQRAIKGSGNNALNTRASVENIQAMAAARKALPAAKMRLEDAESRWKAVCQ